MKKICSIITFLLFVGSGVIWAQSDSTIVTNSSINLDKGTIRLTLEHDIFGGAFTAVGVSNSNYDDTYVFANIGIGVEYAYSTNKTLEANAHFALLYTPMDWEGCTLGVANYTFGLMHHWYHGRWTFGTGLSFERRHAEYLIQRNEDEPDNFQGYQYGDNEFDEKHYNLGADLMVGWGTRMCWFGLRYSPRFIVKDVFKYKEDVFPQLPVTNHAGHIDQQVALVVRLAFKIGKTK